MSLNVVFSSFPTLSTDRFHLRRTQLSDAEAFFQIKSDPEVTSCYGREPHGSLQDTETWIQALQDNYAGRAGIQWAITFKTRDFPIGSCNFWRLDPESPCGEMGDKLTGAARGKRVVRGVLP